MASRANWPQRRIDERRFRFRVRFTYPEGNGWRRTEDLRAWLDKRLGAGNWRQFPDTWDGHGLDAYAIHLDDHTVIPDLVDLLDHQQLVPYRRPVFRAELGSNMVAAIRSAIHTLQNQIVADLNSKGTTVSWGMGTCQFVPGAWQGAWDCLRVKRIGLMGEVDTALSAVPASGEPLAITLNDGQRGAVEWGVTVLQDLRPAPTDTIERLRLLLDALEEVGA